jgi:hypothetical protein
MLQIGVIDSFAWKFLANGDFSTRSTLGNLIAPFHIVFSRGFNLDFYSVSMIFDF